MADNIRPVKDGGKTETHDTAGIGINEFILCCWEACAEGWSFDFRSDMWWGLTAECYCANPGKFTEKTHGPLDVEEGLGRLLKKVMAHNHLDHPA